MLRLCGAGAAARSCPPGFMIVTRVRAGRGLAMSERRSVYSWCGCRPAGHRDPAALARDRAAAVDPPVPAGPAHRPGRTSHVRAVARVSRPNTLAAVDPLVAEMPKGVMGAARQGAADSLYAETAATFLAAHLLRRHAGPPPGWEPMYRCTGGAPGRSAWSTLRCFRSARAPCRRVTTPAAHLSGGQCQRVACCRGRRRRPIRGRAAGLRARRRGHERFGGRRGSGWFPRPFAR
jgi:hypothetical protein